jgi:thioredoxin 1
MKRITPITSEDFQNKVVKSDLPVLVNFHSKTCMPCQELLPVVKELAAEYQGKMNVYECNWKTEGQIFEQFLIKSVPRLIIFKAGKDYWIDQGLRTKTKLRAKMDKILGTMGEEP